VPRELKHFRVAYALMAANFIFPALVYFWAPARGISQFATGNALTLAFTCALLLWDLPRFLPALLPIAFLKAYSSLGFLAIFAKTRYPAFLAVSLFDVATVGAMLVFARRGSAVPEC
jgi:hypothetical protein